MWVFLTCRPFGDRTADLIDGVLPAIRRRWPDATDSKTKKRRGWPHTLRGPHPAKEKRYETE